LCRKAGQLAEHKDVPPEEATRAQSKSGLPICGIRLPALLLYSSAQQGQVMKLSGNAIFITGALRAVWRMFDRDRREYPHRSLPSAINRQVMFGGEAHAE
jgi:hypothetical protein